MSIVLVAPGAMRPLTLPTTMPSAVITAASISVPGMRSVTSPTVQNAAAGLPSDPGFQPATTCSRSGWSRVDAANAPTADAAADATAVAALGGAPAAGAVFPTTELATAPGRAARY